MQYLTEIKLMRIAMKRRFSADGVMHIYQRTKSGFNLFYTLEDFLVYYTIARKTQTRQAFNVLQIKTLQQ